MIVDKNTGKIVGYTQKDREEALTVSLTSLASSLGYTPVREGKNYSLKEMDSLIIYDDKTWYRWSGKGEKTGGTQIDFLMEYGNAPTVLSAIEQLLEFNNKNYIQSVPPCIDVKERSRILRLPPRNKDYKRTYAYLMKTRGLSKEVIYDFIHRGLIYEDAVHHNLVFVGYNPDGVIMYAGLRGTADIYGKKFKGDCPGNNKNYGVNIVNKNNNKLYVFESVIDCMSFIDMEKENQANMLVLGMVEDNPLAQFIKDYNHINSIYFCLDNDEAAHKALYGHMDQSGNMIKSGLLKKYEDMGFNVFVCVPPYGKDWNESLIYKKNNITESGLATLNPNDSKKELNIQSSVISTEPMQNSITRFHKGR